jgi:hypothetical protein
MAFKISVLAQSAITDPAISLRCQELIGARQKKVMHKQKIKELLNRNGKLQSITPPERVSIREKLIQNSQRLEKELELTSLRIQKQEETIIRQGCPGINI